VCFLILGKHNEKRESYGGTVIIDPWGEVIARCPNIDDAPALTTATGGATAEAEATVKKGLGSICYATFDRKILGQIRGSMPVHSHRRRDVYYSKDTECK
jgi:predicted amidohydrolase